MRGPRRWRTDSQWARRGRESAGGGRGGVSQEGGPLQAGDFVSHDREAHERTACVERDAEGRVAEPALTLETIVSLIVAMIFEGRDG